MKSKKRLILLAVTVLGLALALASCSSDRSPFGGLDKDGYTVSVVYDANGGMFTANTQTIVDTYSLKDYKTDAEGNKHLKLFAPDASERGGQAYTASLDGFYLAGWYTERTEIKAEDGTVTGYTYGGRWSFGTDKLAVKADGSYSSNEPVITLYAAWVPAFTYEFYTYNESGAPVLIGKAEKNPFSDTSITLPAFDDASGRVNKPNDFPELSGKTYDKIYLDEAKTSEVTTPAVTHTGSFNAENATLSNPTMRIYCTSAEGVRYTISRPEQLIKSADAAGIYTIAADLDFEGKNWPALFTSNEFTGKIIGNSHTVKNVSITQNNTANTVFGLFGKITAEASVTDITFDNVKSTIKSYARQGTAYGVLAGEIEDEAEVTGVTVKNSKLVIDNNNNLMVAVMNINPKFGTVAAVGEVTGITYSENVTYELSGSTSASYTGTPDANGQFTLTKV